MYDPNEKKQEKLFIEEDFNTTFQKISPTEKLAEKLEYLEEILKKLKGKRPNPTKPKPTTEKIEEKPKKEVRKVSEPKEKMKKKAKNEAKNSESENLTSESEEETKKNKVLKQKANKSKAENKKDKQFNKKEEKNRRVETETSETDSNEEDKPQNRKIPPSSISQQDSAVKLEKGIPNIENNILLKVFGVKALSQEEKDTIISWNNDLKRENQDKIPFYISEIIHFLDKAEEYKNENIKKNMIKASKTYCFRLVKGDGNCSYRAIIFSYLENLLFLIKKEDDVEKELFKNLLKNLWEIEQFNLSINKNRQNASVKQRIVEDNGKLLRKYFLLMLIYLIMHRKKSRNESQTDFSDFFKDFINENPLFDMAMIGFLRCGIRKYYRNNNATYEAFILDDISEMIREMDLEGENSIFKIASDFLQVQIAYVEIENQYKKGDPFEPDNKNKNLKNILLYYRHGHYDILYKNEDIKKEIPIKNYKLNAFQPEMDNSNKYCNNCKENKGDCKKSKNCDHAFCVQCLFTLSDKNHDGNMIKCSVCKSNVMPKDDLNNLFN